MEQTKCLEYYFDSRIYSSEQIQKNINKIKKQFPEKKIKVRLALNDFGVYVVTFEFENKSNYWDKVKIKLISKIKKLLELKKDRLEKYTNNKVYGQYKSTGIYKPY